MTASTTRNPRPGLPTDSDGQAEVQEQLSCLVDGELDEAALPALCGALDGDARLRARWHAYQLIGDVLRSEDLASEPSHDAGFVAALRQRLAAEPAVLAPAAATPRRRHAGWWPVAAAAAVVALVGAGVVLDNTAPQPPISAATNPGQPTPTLVQVADPSGRTMLRDARIDEYLRAHRSAALAGSPAALPGGALRRAEHTATAR